MARFRISSHGRLQDWIAYSVLPCGIYVAPESGLQRPGDLAGVEVGYIKEIPERFHGMIDVRGFGTGERVVFLPYTQEVYERSQRWMQERHLFEEQSAPPALQSVVQV